LLTSNPRTKLEHIKARYRFVVLSGGRKDEAPNVALKHAGAVVSDRLTVLCRLPLCHT
jgi:hypothetical protein